MNQTTILNKINDLNYQGLKEAYLRQIEDTNYNQLSFDERLYNLLEAQEIFVHNKRIQTNFRASKIKDKQASVENIEYSAKRKLDKQVVKSLISMDFIRNHQISSLLAKLVLVNLLSHKPWQIDLFLMDLKLITFECQHCLKK